MKFLLKLFVDRTPAIPDLISAVLALPVDVVFLAASLLAGHVITSRDGVRQGLIVFVGCICLSLVVVVIWRRSEDRFVKDKQCGAIVLGTINAVLSGATLLYALAVISSRAAI